jgi:hypothetical protein
MEVELTAKALGGAVTNQGHRARENPNATCKIGSQKSKGRSLDQGVTHRRQEYARNEA